MGLDDRDNTHEAIVPAEQFELVQRILETETCRPNDAETVALFAGFLLRTAVVGWCADRPAIRESGTSIISVPAANRIKAVARAITMG